MHALRLVLAAALLILAMPARAIVGGSPAAEHETSVVMIVSDRGSFCSAGVLAPTLLLTAGHCVRPGANYRLLTYEAGAPVLSPLGRIVLHPRFNPDAYDRRQFVIDLALVSLAAPLPATYRPLALPAAAEEGVMGARYLILGYGLAKRGDGKSGGTLRQAELVGVPLQSDVQLRLADPQKRTIGACQGDSGGPAFRVSDAQGEASPPVLVGILGSARGSTGRGCGGFSGVALIGTALPWIRETAEALGAGLR
jgi:hypothetical protein